MNFHIRIFLLNLGVLVFLLEQSIAVYGVGKHFVEEAVTGNTFAISRATVLIKSTFSPKIFSDKKE